MKQGKTEKAVFAKLSKVELEQHEVALSVYEAFKSSFKSALDAKQDFDKVYDEVKRLTTVRLPARAEDYEKRHKEAMDYADQYEKAAKDLGVSVGSDYTRFTTILNGLIKEVAKKRNQYK
jgi:hypothetical protein